MRARFVFLMGLVLVGLAPVWRFVLAPRWSERIPPGWSWRSTFTGTNGSPDPKTGKFPEVDATQIYERGIHEVSGRGANGLVELEDFVYMRDPATGKKTWEYMSRWVVDPRTGRHAKKEYSDQIYVFPRSVEKRTYKFRFNYVEGLPMAFQGEAEIEGLQTYLFTYKGRAEYTESYQGTKDYPGVPVKPGQEIRCADDHFILRIWVEPVTGEILKLEERCDSGDYIYDIASGKAVTSVLRWTGLSDGDDVIQRAEWIRARRRSLQWNTWYGPLALLGSGVLLMAAGAGLGRSRKRA